MIQNKHKATEEGFGTRLEQRFSKKQIQQMMEEAGLEKVEFSENIPYWVAVGYKRES
jgi:hypothetical protein